MIKCTYIILKHWSKLNCSGVAGRDGCLVDACDSTKTSKSRQIKRRNRPGSLMGAF